MTFFTNVLAASLAAGRIWWICRRASYFLNRSAHRKYSDLIAILLESGLIYPASLIATIAVFVAPTTSTESVLVCIATVYHLVVRPRSPAFHPLGHSPRNTLSRASRRR
ncbi:hypothetical protein GGX14DRAFT_483653 [Mycena pura]|uniref:Uncharacterized protein n=1 Tax=Mycena pura TaxID=153505 RepID=A0AAD6ULR1_9AGAR|nr:hypothetical protein GGX14DRAFT_483653 [Mycena pura]